MTYFKLGGETAISRVGLGTNRLRAGEAASGLLAGARQLGVDCFDTADIYLNGSSELALGNLLGADEEAVLATKGGYFSGAPEKIASAIDASRAALRRERIDLYYLHRPHRKHPLEQSLDPILAAKQDGRIRHIGLSNVTLEQLDRACKFAPVAAVENAFNLDDPNGQDDVIDYCERHQIAFVAHSPLRGANRAKKIAKRLGVPRTSVAIAALLARSPNVIVIPGSLRVNHIAENLRAASITLTVQDLAELGFSEPR
jgi:aryl-alcohol dehydrogenase-like predicted oxidoreductase